MVVSATLQRRGASGIGIVSAASACAVNFVVEVTGTCTSTLERGRTARYCTTRWTRTSMVFIWSSPVTVSVALPALTARTKPSMFTCATLGSLDDHCSANGFTCRPFCDGTITRSVSTSPGDSRMGFVAWIAASADATTTGAVAVSPPGPVTWSVPCPGASATTFPFWSTPAMSSRSDFQATRTGAAGEPSSRSARGKTRVFSEGRR